MRKYFPTCSRYAIKQIAEHYDSEYSNDGDKSSKKPAMIKERVTSCKHMHTEIGRRSSESYIALSNTSCLAVRGFFGTHLQK